MLNNLMGICRRLRDHICCGLLVGSVGCASAGPPRTYQAPRTVDPTASVEGVAGIGFESQDFVAMGDRMVRDLTAAGLIGNSTVRPRLIIDATRFKNESVQRFNNGLVIERLRIALLRAAQGRLVIVSRENVDLVESEKQLKASGVVDAANSSTDRAIAGADYLMVVRVSSQATVDPTSGMRSNFFQFAFELLDLNTSEVVWGNIYDVKKAGADETIYHD